MIKILRQPIVELIIKPQMDWDRYARFLKSNYKIDNSYGLDLDEESRKALAFHPGDGIPMACAKTCYKAWDKGRKNAKEYLTNIIEVGHGSVLEHANFGFIIVTTRVSATKNRGFTFVSN